MSAGAAYYDTVEEFGFVVEAIEVLRRRRAPDFVWPPANEAAGPS